MINLRTVSSLLLCSCVTALTAAESGLWYAANGSRLYPDQDVPRQWDASTGKHIRWKTPLPNWSNGSPLLVGDKIFIMSEPTDYAPYLSCIDAESGKELWQVVLDPIVEFPESEQAKHKTLVQECWAWNRDMIRLWNDVHDWYKANTDKFDKRLKLKEDARSEFDKQFKSRLDALELSFDGFTKGAGGMQTKFPVPKGSARYEKLNTLAALGLKWEFWTYFGTWNGNTFSTPASDGERVFTATGNNLFSCYDLQGTLLWQHRYPWPSNRKVDKQVDAKWHERITRTERDGRKKLAWPFSTQGLASTSPVCVDGKFISCMAAWIRCFDAKTGSLVWDMPMRGGIAQNCMTPGVINLAGTNFVIVPPGEGRSGEAGDDIIRVSDGKICGILPGSANSKMSIAGPIISADTVVTYAGNWRDRDMVCFQLAYDPAQEKVTCTQKWSIKKKAIRGLGLWRACIHDKRLLFGAIELDLATGKVHRDKLPDARHRYCWWSGMVVGDHYVSIDHTEGNFVFRELASGKPSGQASLPKHNPEVYDEQRIRGEERSGKWSVLSAATPLAYKNRLYVRSYDYLWCIGKD